MSQISSLASRTSSLQASNQLLAALQRTQQEMLENQQQISTGKRATRPSDAPESASAILSLQARSESHQQLQRNLQHARNVLDSTGQSLHDVVGILEEVQNVAIRQTQFVSDPNGRDADATIVADQIRAVVEIANRRFQEVPLFGGHTGISAQKDSPFVDFLGGVRYIGGDTSLASDVGLDEPLGFNSSGVEAFGALSSRVQGGVDLNPRATESTRLADLNGAFGRGVRLGAIQLSVGDQREVVDLSDADTLGDVVTRVNAVIEQIDDTAGFIALTPTGLSLTANTGHSISIRESGAGQTAGDLGIVLQADSQTLDGAVLTPRLTELTPLVDLGTAVDFNGGLRITQGIHTKVADFSNAETIQDLINTVEQLDLGLRLEINQNGTGLDLISEVSGLELSVSENANGTTAQGLGLRTFGVETRLSDFNHGIGVGVIEQEDDFAITLHDGTRFHVNLDGAATVQDVIDTIQASAVDAGLTVGQPGDVGTAFNVGLAADTNGLRFEDGTIGSEDFRVDLLGQSLAAVDLGIHINAGGDDAIAGTDQATVRVEGLLTNMIFLRDSLVHNDWNGIRFAQVELEGDDDRLIRAQGDVAVRGQRVLRQQERLDEVTLAESILLSDLQDADLTEVITRFSQLQRQLEATLRVGSANLQLSLLDFLR